MTGGALRKVLLRLKISPTLTVQYRPIVAVINQLDKPPLLLLAVDQKSELVAEGGMELSVGSRSPPLQQRACPETIKRYVAYPFLGN